ncbi:MAG: hypothetical protein WDO56_34125 [Gammaproteobacteria bacterium]
MRTLRLTVTALLASPLLGAAAHAGVYLESLDKELDGSETPKTSKMWFDGGRMRTERPGHEGDLQVVIFKNQAMYTVDSKSKSYRVIDKATAGQMGAQVANAKKQMEARMAAMPPEQRKKMEEMMAKMGKGGAAAMLPGAPKPSPRTLRNSGRTETVAGIKCTLWEAFEDGQKQEELCAAPAGSLPGGDDVMKTFRDISTMLSSFTESLGSGRTGNQPWNDMDKINGVPILTRDFDNGKASSEMRLTVVRKESVPAASFDVPEGYKEKKLDLGHPTSGDDD